MPIPSPTESELKLSDGKDKFISRCNSALINEFPDNDQRNAVCFSQWRNANKKDDSIDINERKFDIRLDYNNKESNFRIDEETGFLNCDVNFTRTGVFDYYDENGNLMRELRPEDEVFSKDSVNSLKFKPVLDNHPEKLVTVENIKDLQIGMIGENIVRKDIFLNGRIIITNKDMVETISARRALGLNTEVSCGYRCKVEPKIGEHKNDGYYTFVQKDIKYNHISIVDKGRAGENVRILDYKDKIEKSALNKTKKGECKMPQEEIKDVKFNKSAINIDSLKMDAISIVVNEDALPTLDTMSLKLDEAVTLISKLNSEKDELQGKCDQLDETVKTQKNDIDELSNVNSPRVMQMINDRQNVILIAEKLKVDHKDKSVKDTMIDCIKSVSKDFDASDKSEGYVKGRFDSLIDVIKNSDKQDSANDIGQFIFRAKQVSGEVKNPRAEFIKKDEENRKASN